MVDRRWSGAPRWEPPALAVVAGVGFALRFVRLDLGWFGVDQARDVATALDIVNGRAWPLIGPTMRRVTRLGALYHYFWALPYLLWRDPIAGYWFAAVLSIAALVLTWGVARRLWGAPAALVTAAVAAAHPVWVIDGRVCWAPAALPFMAAALTWLALGTASGEVAPAVDGRSARRVALAPARIAAIGALLGLAVQLHLTMVGFAAGLAVVAILDRLPARTLAAAVASAAIVGAPALWAMLPTSAAGDRGITSLATRAPLTPLTPRLVASAMLPARLLRAFGAGLGSGGGTAPALAVATAFLAVLAATGLLRLVATAVRGDRGARVVLLPGGVTAILVLLLPGDAWYYYLDGVLPLWALAVGASVAERVAATTTSMYATSSRASIRVRRIVGGAALTAAAVLAAYTASWLLGVAAAGYIEIEPTGLTLDGRPGGDIAHAGRVTTLAVKRRAGAAAATLGGDFEALWYRVHGPAVADATGDNGFWFQWSLARASGGAAKTQNPTSSDRHLAVWYRDDPTAVRLVAAAASADVDVFSIGPLLAVRYTPLLDYASCRSETGPVTVPIRVTPDPRRYGDGTPALPTSLPSRVSCTLRPASHVAGEERHGDAAAADAGDHPTERLVVGALGGDGTVALLVDDRRASAGREVALCVASSTAATVGVAIERPTGAPAELDLYDVPLGVGCESRTAARVAAAER